MADTSTQPVPYFLVSEIWAQITAAVVWYFFWVSCFYLLSVPQVGIIKTWHFCYAELIAFLNWQDSKLITGSDSQPQAVSYKMALDMKKPET